MIRVIPKKSKSAIRAKVQMMTGKKLEAGKKYTPEVMFIQVFNEKNSKLQNYVIHMHQWDYMKGLIDRGETPMFALLQSWDVIKVDKVKVAFLNTVCKLLSIWGFIDIRPEGFKSKIFSKENTIEWIEVYNKEEFENLKIELPYSLEDLIKYLRDSNVKSARGGGLNV